MRVRCRAVTATVTTDDIERAAERIGPVIRVTPTMTVDGTDLDVAGTVSLKLEMVQHSGTFKGPRRDQRPAGPPRRGPSRPRGCGGSLGWQSRGCRRLGRPAPGCSGHDLRADHLGAGQSGPAPILRGRRPPGRRRLRRGPGRQRRSSGHRRWGVDPRLRGPVGHGRRRHDRTGAGGPKSARSTGSWWPAAAAGWWAGWPPGSPVGPTSWPARRRAPTATPGPGRPANR